MNMELYIKRREYRMSQTEVAHFLGITQQTYSLKEQGKNEFTIKEARKLAKLFNSSIDELFKEVQHGA